MRSQWKLLIIESIYPIYAWWIYYNPGKTNLIWILYLINSTNGSVGKEKN